MSTPETTLAVPAEDTPWAQLRSVDPDGPPAPPCQHCTRRPILQFRAAYTLTSTAGTPIRDEEDDLWACQEHSGVIAAAAAMRVLNGPHGTL